MNYKQWLQMMCMSVLLVMLASCGEATSTSTSVSTSTSAHSQSTSSVSTTLTTKEYVDKSEYIMNLFGGNVMGNGGQSDMVYDLDAEDYDTVQKIIDEGDIPLNIRNDYQFPLVSFDSDDGRKFNEYMKGYAHSLLSEWSEGLIGYLKTVREQISENGYRYIKYGVLESEKYLSIIVVNAHTDMGYTSPVYLINSYVFEKSTGRFVPSKELMAMAANGEKELIYEGIANFSRAVVDGRKEEDIGIYYNLNYFLGAFWDYVQDDLAGTLDDTNVYNVGNISGFSLYVDSAGEIRALLCTDYLTGIFKPESMNSVEKIEEYTFYNDKVIDVPLSVLRSEELRENPLYNTAREHFGIAETPDVLMAYIGFADDYTLRTFQYFTDLFEVDYLSSDLVVFQNYQSDEYAPRSVYLVIPRYQNAVTAAGFNNTEGFAVVSVDQNENLIMPIRVKYGEKELLIHQPVKYDIGVSSVEQEDVYDFTDALVPFYDPTAELREEVEDFFYFVRTMG